MEDELENILKEYENANSSHNWESVESFVHRNAVYWFTDGKYEGIDEIKEAVEKTFQKIQEENYSIQDVNWLVATDKFGVCTYLFHWGGIVDGVQRSGNGKGTNVFIKDDEGSWKIIHEHLSK